MTAANVSGRSPELSSFIQIWADSFAQVLVQIAPAQSATVPGSEAPSPIVVIAEVSPEAPPTGAPDLWILGTCSGRLRGELSLRIPAGSILRLGEIFIGELSESTLTAEPAPEQREAVVELVRQVAGLATTAVKMQWGEVQLRLDAAEAAPSWPASSTVWLRVGTDPAKAAMVEIHVSAALAAALRRETAADDASIPKPPPAQPGSADSQPSEQGKGHVDAKDDAKVQLDLLLDVELAVTLRFGSRWLALREILDLNPGAVIELDRQVEEPVDMLLDGRVVARGEVVVMDGNYALRVTEVGSTAGL
jgi:flagellar motor switch protein FliN